tara:strand:- start:3245 stop:3628 length:384 start_codon:yes stop_codon:yes gene_type:complete
MAVMPKPKPDQVIRHEIALSRPMQEAVDQYVIAHSFESISTPMVDLMKDVSGMAVFLSIVAALGIGGVAFSLILTGSEQTSEEVIKEYLSQYRAAKVLLYPGEQTQAVGSAITSGISDLLNTILQRN